MNAKKYFTRSQLSLKNGQDSDEIWVAFKGVIYDVTNSRYWKKGHHYEHWGGQDLTDEFKFAPHTERVFTNLNKVGYLQK